MVDSLNINNKNSENNTKRAESPAGRGKAEDNKNKDYNDHANHVELQIQEESTPPSGSEKPILRLIVSLEEISRDAYLLRHGNKSLDGDPLTSTATRIAKVKLKQVVFKSSSIKTGDKISIKVFDEIEYIAVIDHVLVSGNSQAITGKIEKTDLAYLNLSITENLLLASIDMAELNISYLLRYNHQSATYYLFAAPYDQIDKPTHY